MPRDHTVPRMYLRRFATQHKRQSFTTMMRIEEVSTQWETNIANVAAPSDFYSFSDSNGSDHRDLEVFFSRVENLAEPVFRTILDHPKYELPPEWPLNQDQRIKMAWFIAAQIVRTTRQRRRLEVAVQAERLDMPGTLSEKDLSSEHARFIAGAIGAIALGLSSRPWALAHSSACLVTSDCPVVLLDDHDANDQIFAGLSSAILFPLDPHRAIFMPSRSGSERDLGKLSDHRMKMDGVGTAFVQAVVDSAYEYLFAHPDHPLGPWARAEGRLPRPGEPPRERGWEIEYTPLHPNLSIEKGWKHHSVQDA